jgi:hypothetical protein
VCRLLTDWDDAAADALFSENVALDRPYPERRADLALLAARIGAFTVDASRPAESDTPAHRRWWLAGERATVMASIQLSPQRPPRVQSLTLAIPPARDGTLGRALATLLGWLNDGAADWPRNLPVSPEADAGLITRRLRMAATWAGRVVPGAYQAGDGGSSVTVELAGEHATITLALLVNPDTGELRQADVTLLFVTLCLPGDHDQVRFAPNVAQPSKQSRRLCKAADVIRLITARSGRRQVGTVFLVYVSVVLEASDVTTIVE